MTTSTLPTIMSPDALQQCINESPATLFWFTGPDCRVCKDLKPKVLELITQQFPEIRCHQINCAETPDVAAQQQVFTVPTLLVFLEGQEFIRLSRSFSLNQLTSQLQRPYQLLFG